LHTIALVHKDDCWSDRLLALNARPTGTAVGTESPLIVLTSADGQEILPAMQSIVMTS
jgi:hypothetical protein